MSCADKSVSGEVGLPDRIRELQHGSSFSADAPEHFKKYSEQLLCAQDSFVSNDTSLVSAARLIEVGDFLGRPQGELQRLCKDDERVFNSLPGSALKKTDWTPHLDASLRYGLACIQAGEYRRGEYDTAVERICRCLRLLINGPSTAAKALRARAHHLLGHAFRNSGNLVHARHHFSEAIRHDRKWATAATAEGLSTDLFGTITVLNLMGLASIEIRTGSLTRALSFVHIATEHLPDGNKLLAAMVQLTYGSALRHYAGDSDTHREMLKKAIRRLESARQVFAEYDHQRNFARTSLELAMAAMSMRDKAAATEYLTNRDTRSEQMRDERWTCETLLCRSRMSRELEGQFKDAEHNASLALERAKASRLQVSLVEALIERGRALLAQSKADLACQDLDTAFSEATSQRQKAVAALLRAQAYVRLGQPEHARQWLEVGEALSEPFELPVITTLAHEVRHEYENTPDNFVLVIDPEKTGLKYDDYENELRRALVRLALKRSGNRRSKAAESLNITRTTLNAWIDLLELERRRPGHAP